MNIIINSKKMSMKISDEPTSLGRLDFSELVSANSGGNNSRDSSASTEGVSAMKELKNRKNNKHKKTTDFLDYIKDKGIQFNLSYEDNEECKSPLKSEVKTKKKIKPKKEKPTLRTNHSTAKLKLNLAAKPYIYKQPVNTTSNVNKTFVPVTSAPYCIYPMLIKTQSGSTQPILTYINSNITQSFTLGQVVLPPQIEQQVMSYQNNELYIHYQYMRINNLLSHNELKHKEENTKEPQRPFFYLNHNEEVETHKVLNIIEYLFSIENLNEDYNIRRILNEEGYVSVDDLVDKHPQMKKFELTKEKINDILSEHRMNEITETVETFDGIIIRNKNWNEKQNEIDPIDKVISHTTAMITAISMNMKIKTINTGIIYNMIKLYEQSANVMNQRKNLLQSHMMMS